MRRKQIGTARSRRAQKLIFERALKMAIGDIPSGYWSGPRIDRKSPSVRADKISKTAWQDLYFDLFLQTTHDVKESITQEVVIADAEKRLKSLKKYGVRRA